MTDDDMDDLERDGGQRRPLGMVLLGCLYLFFLLLTMTTFGQPLPFFGRIFTGRTADVLVYVDSLICLYLFLGLVKRQYLTWYLLMAYNVIEIVNTLVCLVFLPVEEIVKISGEAVDSQALLVNNLSIMAMIIVLTVCIYRSRRHFTNRSAYLF